MSMWYPLLQGGGGEGGAAEERGGVHTLFPGLLEREYLQVVVGTGHVDVVLVGLDRAGCCSVGRHLGWSRLEYFQLVFLAVFLECAPSGRVGRQSAH